MKFLLLAFIKLYWKIIPENKRNQCIYNVSCSNYVYNTAKTKGLFFGIKAFKERFKSCKPGYLLFKDKGKWHIKTVNNIIIYQDNINPDILQDIKNNENFRRK